MKLRRTSNIIVFTAMLACCQPATQSSNLALEDGWVRAVPPGMNMTAGYGRITNRGGDTLEISAFSSNSFADVSLHQTITENGVSRMKSLTGLTLAPGATAVLEPRGLHLMLMNPTRGIQPGESVELTLTAASGERYLFSLPVEAR